VPVWRAGHRAGPWRVPAAARGLEGRRAHALMRAGTGGAPPPYSLQEHLQGKQGVGNAPGDTRPVRLKQRDRVPTASTGWFYLGKTANSVRPGTSKFEFDNNGWGRQGSN
jgi:hypothetical protein